MFNEKADPGLSKLSNAAATGQTVTATYGLNAVPKDKKLSTLGLLKVIGGFIYLVCTCACSIYYLTFLFPSISNDNIVPNFDRAQVFLADLYNNHLDDDNVDEGTRPLDLFDKKESLIGKDYNDPNVAITMHPSRLRSIIHNYLTLEVALEAVRNVDMISNMKVWPAPCWLDYQRRWEMAHTAQRQANCKKRSDGISLSQCCQEGLDLVAVLP
jgi:hypothetical protein